MSASEPVCLARIAQCCVHFYVLPFLSRDFPRLSEGFLLSTIRVSFLSFSSKSFIKNVARLGKGMTIHTQQSFMRVK
jgi:hypothetical protein